MQRTLDRYLLLEQIGSTGLSTVYRAQAPEDETEVALKVLRPYISEDPALLAKFEAGILNIVKLRHTNILPIYAKETDGDFHWITMQHVSWPTLRQWAQHPVPIPQAIMIINQVCGAIELAHSQGISHGDIKPGNIFIDPDTGRVLVADFGISIIAGGAPATVRAALNIPLPAYTAPELDQQAIPNLQSDMYSIGTLFYDMITGSVPFAALERATVRAKQLTSTPTAPSKVNQNVPDSLDQVVLRAITPHPETRYNTPSEFVKALATTTPDYDNPQLFPVNWEIETQRSFSGMEPSGQEVTPQDGDPVICSICGKHNLPNASWCLDCRAYLTRVAANTTDQVVPTEERQRRYKVATFRRKMMTIAAIIGVIGFTAFQILDIRMPLDPPTSDLTSEPGNSEWTTINRTLDGSGPVPGETTEFSGNIRWSFNAGDSLASTPSVKNGVVYLTTLDKQVIALDEATGEVIWEHASVAPIDASPTIAGNILVYGARDRRVIALDITTGDKLWEFVTEANPTAGSAIVEDGIAYIGSGDSNVYAIDVMTGEKQWHYPTREWITNTPALAEGILVVGSLDGRIGLYDTDTGKRRFEFRGINRQILGSPVIAGDDIFITYRNGLMYSLNLQEEEVVFHNQWHRMKMQLFWWNMMGNPGHPKGVNWSTFLWGTLVTSPAVDEDTVYVSTNEGRMYGVDRETGKRVWVYKSGSTRLSSPTLVNGVLLVSDNQGVVHAVDSKTGKEIWSIPVATRSSSKPVVANGSMYIASQDGTLYAVE